MDRLAYNLSSRIPLRFSTEGKFKILMMSDIQETLDYDPRTLADMHRLVAHEAPDLVVLGGDNCNGKVLKTEEELSAYLDVFSAPMEDRGIPWVHVFGNHDHDVAVPPLRQAALYERFPHCLSKHTEGITGTTNFVLPVYAADGSEIAFHVWGLDSNHKIKTSGLFPGTDPKLPNLPIPSGVWDIVHFDQLMWYWQSAEELEAYSGKKTHGILFMHIAPWEFQAIVDNPAETGGAGSMVETMGLGRFNSGLFAALLQRDEIKCIACGHSHNDCFSGSWCGVQMCLDACAGYSPYGIDSLRGGRVFVIDQNDTASPLTYMSHYANL